MYLPFPEKRKHRQQGRFLQTPQEVRLLLKQVKKRV
jgi:hypothetical protein